MKKMYYVFLLPLLCMAAATLTASASEGSCRETDKSISFLNEKTTDESHPKYPKKKNIQGLLRILNGTPLFSDSVLKNDHPSEIYILKDKESIAKYMDLYGDWAENGVIIINQFPKDSIKSRKACSPKRHAHIARKAFRQKARKAKDQHRRKNNLDRASRQKDRMKEYSDMITFFNGKRATSDTLSSLSPSISYMIYIYQDKGIIGDYKHLYGNDAANGILEIFTEDYDGEPIVKTRQNPNVIIIHGKDFVPAWKKRSPADSLSTYFSDLDTE